MGYNWTPFKKKLDAKNKVQMLRLEVKILDFIYTKL